MISQKDLNTARLLIVDDEENNVFLLERMLRQASYANIHTASDSRTVVDLFYQIEPDLILLDLHMPPPDGFALLEQLSDKIVQGSLTPILVLTADISAGARLRALGLGARDFLTKPIERIELLLRVRNLLETRFLYHKQNQEADFDTSLAGIVQSYQRQNLELMQCLAHAAELRCGADAKRAFRVADYAGAVARSLGLSAEESEAIQKAALLHDVGKVGLSDEALANNSALNAGQRVKAQAHTNLGAELFSTCTSDLLQLARSVALAHHERWDGDGYPEGLQGDQIPLAARIVSVADYYDHLLTNAAGALSEEEAQNEIMRQSSYRFDPTVAKALLKSFA